MIPTPSGSLGAPPEPLLSDTQFRELRDFLYRRSGLFFSDTKKFLLESRLQKRLRALELDSAEEYLARLRSPARCGREVLELLDVVTTHETSFFRNRPQLEAFRRHALPEVLRLQRQRGSRLLRIWSAGCSSGEEPYSLAMLVLEALGDEASRWKVQILGTDIARSALEQAERAVYSSYSFRNAPAYYVQKYFEHDTPQTLRLKEEPKRLVRFGLLNFADDLRMRAMKGFQVIFCRNALIYFDREAKRRFVAHFARALDPGGYFFIGHAESLHGISDAFKLVHFAGALGYRKPLPPSADKEVPWAQTA
ncbi:MAG: protein-glutamate O-methyltransferase CheR [Deferrisomatales bacterium]